MPQIQSTWLSVTLLVLASITILVFNSYFAFAISTDHLFSFFIGYLMVAAFSFLLKKYIKMRNRTKFVILSAPLIVDFVVFSFSTKELELPLLVGILVIFLVFKTKKWRPLNTLLVIGGLAVYSFLINPFLFLFNNLKPVSTSIHIPHTGGGQLNLYETWHEHCGTCFIAMKDLHPFLSACEKQFNFNHAYLYVGGAESDSVIYHNKHFPHGDMEVLLDKNQEIHNQLGLYGAPYFIFFDGNGVVLYKMGGYWSPYRFYYKQYFKYIINKHT